MKDLAKLKKLIYKNLDLIFANLGIEVEEFNNNWYSTCPVHDDSDNNRAFSYNLEKNLWKCWTHGCQEDYNCDIFGLIRGVLSKRSGIEVSFGEVLGWVSKVLNLDHRELDTKEIKKEVTDDFLGLVKKFNQKPKIITDVQAKEWPSTVPSKYFVTRNFEPETLTHFNVGDCLDRSSKMRFRSVIPTYNEDGTVMVGSICRSTLDYIEPKFLCDFDKSNYLYNHFRAKEKAMEKSCLFLVEGQGDVWRLWEAGVINAVGLFGKEIYPEQERKINQMGITKLIILLDHDQAGRESKIKIQRQFGRYFTLVFPKLRARKDVGQMSPTHIKEKILVDLKGCY